MNRVVLSISIGTVCLVGSLASKAYGYELATHGAVTYEAYKRSVLKDEKFFKNLGIDTQANPSEPFGVSYYDISGNTVTERMRHEFEGDVIQKLGPKPLSLEGWIMRGAIREDDWTDIDQPGCHLQAPNPNDDKLDRPGNHFYDPIHDRPLTVGASLGQRAPDWGLGTANFLADPPQPDSTRRNHYSILDAREAMYRALTGRARDGREVAPTQAERNKYWATTFRALGDVVHLVQDMGQPQHTRNDPHLGCYLLLAGEASVYEKYIESRALGLAYGTPKGQTVLAPMLDYLGASAAFPDGYPVPRFTDYASFFTTRHRHDSVPARQGLADYSNRGFFSAGKNLNPSESAEYEYPSGNYRSYGRQTIDRNWAGESFGGSVTLLTNSVADALAKHTDTDVPLTTFGVWDQFLEKRNTLLRDYSLNRYNYDAMADLLIPRAVAYSAGLIDYFFRGRLEAQDAGFSDNGIVLRVKNAIDPRTQDYWQDEALAKGGTLLVTLRYQVPIGNEPDRFTTVHFTSNPTELGEEIRPERASWNLYEFTGLPSEIPIDATDVEYRLVYRGPIGQEQDGIAVGVFKPVSGFLVTPNFAPADGLSSAGEKRLVYRSQGQWRLSRDTSIQAGNIDWKGWYIGGRATKVLSWVGPPIRYFPAYEYYDYASRRDRSESTFENVVYQGGEVFAVAPGNVLGAAVARDSQGFDWLIVVCTEGVAESIKDVVYRRPYKKSSSAALFHEVDEPEGWKKIGEWAPTEGDPPGSFTQPADIPWFFNGSGTEAQTVRRWWSGSIDWPEGLRKRLKLELRNDLTTAAFSIEDRGEEGFVRERTCSASYDQYGAGSGQYQSTSSGEYTFAVDYKDMAPVLAQIRVQGSASRSSNVSVTHDHEPDKHSKDVLAGSSQVADSYDEYLVRKEGGAARPDVHTFTAQVGPYEASWSRGPSGSTYRRVLQNRVMGNEVTYVLDLRSDHYGYYSYDVTDRDEIVDATEHSAEDLSEGSHLAQEGSVEQLHGSSPRHYEANRSSYGRDYEVRCTSFDTGKTVSYGTSNFGWWSWYGRSLGTIAVDSEGREFRSIRLVADFGYEEVGSANKLAEGANLESLIPGAPSSGALYYPIAVVR